MTRIVYTSPFVPAELIVAHGAQASRIFPSCVRASKCGTVEGLCPYAQGFVHEVCETACADGVVLTTTCDQMRRAADLIAVESGIPLFLMNVPATWQTAASSRLYMAELKRLGRFVETLGGKAVSLRTLKSAMVRYDEMRATLRVGVSTGITSGYLNAVAKFHREGKLGPQVMHGRKLSKGLPVAILGGPLPADEWWFVDMINDAGGRIVLDATENGERTLPSPFNRNMIATAPFGELVRAYFRAIPDVFQRPNIRLYEWLAKSLTERGVRGVIVRHYVWCDMWRAEVLRIVERTGLPVLHIDVDGGRPSLERTLTRVQAFMEMLR